MLGAVGRAEVDKFVDVVLHAGLAEHRVGDQGSTHAADGEPVRFGDFENVIGRLAAAARLHVLDDDVGTAGDVPAKNVDHGAGAQVGRTRRRSAQHDTDRLIGIEIGLRPSRVAVESADAHQQKQHRLYHKIRSSGAHDIVNKTSYSSAA